MWKRRIAQEWLILIGAFLVAVFVVIGFYYINEHIKFSNYQRELTQWKKDYTEKYNKLEHEYEMLPKEKKDKITWPENPWMEALVASLGKPPSPPPTDVEKKRLWIKSQFPFEPSPPLKPGLIEELIRLLPLFFISIYIAVQFVRSVLWAIRIVSFSKKGI